MKNATLVPALLIAAAGLFSSSIAQASCQNICVRAYNACLASGIPQSECEVELDQCLADCMGGGGGAKLALKGEDAKCVQPERKLPLPVRHPAATADSAS